jgi:hypothetical protein
MTTNKRTTTSKKLLLIIKKRIRVAAADARIVRNHRDALGAPIVTLPRFGKRLGFSGEHETPGTDLTSPSSALVQHLLRYVKENDLAIGQR